MRNVVNENYYGYIGYVGSDKPLLNFVIEPDLLKRIDDWRFKHRFATRAAAIKWLLAWALDQKPAPPKERAEQ